MTIAIIAVCCVGIALQALFIDREHKKEYTAALILKSCASACFVILGFITARKAADAGFARFVVLGLCLGMGGDILLNLRFLSEKKGNLIFLIGILVFLSGHVMYLAALIPMCKNIVPGLVLGAVFTAVILLWIFSQITAKPAFKIFGVFYIGAIVIMTTIAIMNLIAGFSVMKLIFAVGAVLFLLSDIILIINNFGGKNSKQLRTMNLALYYIGQLCIAICLLFA
ncbi:MAG: lysoplasmalogenase [Lachnospiraceae bacterium]|nr:lysoplasmalogenase [Lachnospiraceae bacterium]MBP5653364.1 lysoplasmalogenase [Lachnospiraceae bacterium]